jgi:hypothetical protein
MTQIEISGPVPALEPGGRPVNFGWARKPFLTYHGGLNRGPAGRLTESDRYIIYSATHLMIMEILDGGYLGYISISVVPLGDKNRSTQTFPAPFSLGSFALPQDSETDSIRIQRRKAIIEFAVMDGGTRLIKLDIPRFGHRRHLRGVVVLTPPPDAESLITHTPWPGDKYAYRLSRRSPWYVAEGVMQFGREELVFTKGSAWGIFDWNRGLRPRRDVRYWAAACGQAGEGQIGFSVGYGAADASRGTENAFFLDGKLHKLDQVTFHISPANWLLPWRFTSNDNRLEMTFSPHQERIEHHRMFLHSLKRRQVCGSFSGKVTLDTGAVLEFQNLTGMAERRKTRF